MYCTLYSTVDMDFAGGGEEDVLHYEVAQLSVSPENTILHYLHLDVGEVSHTSHICRSNKIKIYI